MLKEIHNQAKVRVRHGIGWAAAIYIGKYENNKHVVIVREPKFIGDEYPKDVPLIVYDIEIKEGEGEQ